MSANSAVQHLASGVGASIGGLIVKSNIENFNRVGLLAAAATLVSLWLAGRVRPAQEESQTPLDTETTRLSTAVPEESVLDLSADPVDAHRH